MAVRLDRALDLTGSELRALHWGAQLHVTGKMAIPDATLH